ncbi:hypothetical protein BGZ94_009436 [Podila epigama]|nr:hypothetical protein BGZ94_009436 [Podila epigama]
MPVSDQISNASSTIELTSLPSLNTALVTHNRERVTRTQKLQQQQQQQQQNQQQQQQQQQEQPGEDYEHEEKRDKERNELQGYKEQSKKLITNEDALRGPEDSENLSSHAMTDQLSTQTVHEERRQANAEAMPPPSQSHPTIRQLQQLLNIHPPPPNSDTDQASTLPNSQETEVHTQVLPYLDQLSSQPHDSESELPSEPIHAYQSSIGTFQLLDEEDDSLSIPIQRQPEPQPQQPSLSSSSSVHFKRRPSTDYYYHHDRRRGKES